MTEQAPPRVATLRDVARIAGVSPAAVSKVIRNAYGVSPAMRERVGAAIDELDYRPSVAARAMRGSSYTLGIEIQGFGNQFFTKILAGATEALQGTRYQLIIAPAEPVFAEGYRALEALADRQVDGLVAVSPLVDSAWLERVAKRLPLVMLGRHDDSVGYDTVVGDDERGARLVMDHLLGLGHRRIAHLTRSPEVTSPHLGTPHGVRLTVFEKSMRAAGLAGDMVLRTGPTEQDAYLTCRELLAGPDRPSAIFAGNDQLALGALQALADLGLTPADVSVAGYDDIDIAAHPGISLTTVDQQGHEMGRQAIGMLIERIEGRTTPRRFVSTVSLRARGSTRSLD
jgi:LacI family transcriptional regulator